MHECMEVSQDLGGREKDSRPGTGLYMLNRWVERKPGLTKFLEEDPLYFAQRLRSCFPRLCALLVFTEIIWPSLACPWFMCVLFLLLVNKGLNDRNVYFMLSLRVYCTVSLISWLDIDSGGSWWMCLRPSRNPSTISCGLEDHPWLVPC